MNRKVIRMIIFLVVATLFFSSSTALADIQQFDQNQGGFGGYQVGSYDSNAVQPTADNCDRVSRFMAGKHPQLKWFFPADSPITATPVVGCDETVYFGAEDGKFFALDKHGQEKWVFTTGGKICSSAAIAENGNIYLTSQDGQLRALNHKGQLQWSYHTGDILETAPVIGEDGAVYIGCKGGSLYALDSGGNFKWRFDTAGIDFPVSIGQDGAIYVSSRSGDLICVNHDGTQRWKCRLGSNPSAPAIDKDNNVYVYNRNSLYVISPQGIIRHSFSLNQGTEVKSSIAMSADGRIYVGGNEFYVYSPGWANVQTYKVYACSTPLIGADGTIYVGSKDFSGKFSALDKQGNRIWQYGIGGIVGAPVLTADGTIYLGSRDGKLYALDTYQLEAVETDPAAGENMAMVDKNINVMFNKRIYPGVDYERIEMTDALLQPIPINKAIEDKKLAITPRGSLEKDLKYIVRIPCGAVKSDLGRSLEKELILRFSTTAGPDVSALAEFVIGQKFYRLKGEPKDMDAEPFIENDRSFVPVRYLALGLGIIEKDIRWDNVSQTVTLLKGDKVLRVSLSSNLLDINGQKQEMDVSPINADGRVYLPARYIAEAFGYMAYWDETVKVVSIK